MPAKDILCPGAIVAAEFDWNKSNPTTAVAAATEDANNMWILLVFYLSNTVSYHGPLRR